MDLNDIELHEKIKLGAAKGVHEALKKHKALGQSVVVQNNGRPEIVEAKDIPDSITESLNPGNSG